MGNEVELPGWETLKAEGSDVLEALERAKADGRITKEEVGEVMTELLEVAMVTAEAFDVPGEQRKQWVLDLLWGIYKKEIDIDIPIIFEPFETMAEKAIFYTVFGSAIDLVIKATKGLLPINRAA